jgi:hypothetical protein
MNVRIRLNVEVEMSNRLFRVSQEYPKKKSSNGRLVMCPPHSSFLYDLQCELCVM